MTQKDCSHVIIHTSAAIGLFISFIVLAIIAVIGNLIIIIAVVKDPLKKLHTPFNYFLVHLSVCDFIAGAIPMPLTAYYMYSQSQGLHLTFSKLELCATIISASSVILSTCALSIDRLIGITHPLKYRQHLSWTRCVAISVCIWVVSIIVGLLVTFVGNRKYAFTGFYYSAIICGAIVIAVVYFKVHRFLRIHEEDFRKRLAESMSACQHTIMQRCKMEKKVTRVFLIILAVFILSYVPGLAFLNVMQYCEECSCQLRYDLYHIRYLLSVSNSSLNPIIYMLLLKDFRLSIKAMITNAPRRRTQSNQIAASTGSN